MKQMIMNIKRVSSISYPIMIDTDLLKIPDQWLPTNWRSLRLVIITDDTVRNYYGNMLRDRLSESNPLLLSFEPGEKSKNYQTKIKLIEKMIEHHCDRESLILALGGGVVGDLAGFIAATFMRGVPYIQLPTSLLAMIDSSVGGKTGINLTHGKNLIGSFWQPKGVAIDLNCLKTLPDAHIINGLIEAIKIFLTNDENYFNYISQSIDGVLNKDIGILKAILTQAIKLKISIVSDDEREMNKRVIVNFGHTIGHALEKLTNYTLLHGYAVALGILVEAKISNLLGLITNDEFECIEVLLKKLNITAHQLKSFDINSIIAATHVDKKIKSNQVRYVLLKKIGEVYQDKHTFAHPVADEMVKSALRELYEL